MKTPPDIGSAYKLYIGTMTYRDDPEGSSLPVWSREEPTPEEVAIAWEVDYDPENDTEKFISVDGPEIPKIIDNAMLQKLEEIKSKKKRVEELKEKQRVEKMKAIKSAKSKLTESEKKALGIK